MSVYAELLPKRRWFAKHLSDLMPWRSIAAPGVILHKQTHALQRSYLMRGPDLSSEVQEVQGALMLQANNVFKRLGGAWTVQCEAQRLPTTAYPESLFPMPAATLIDDERRRALLIDPGSFETTYYLTLTWQPPSAANASWTRLFVAGLPETNGHGPHASLRDFLTQANYLVYLLRGMLTVARPLTTDETLTYLHNGISDRWHPVVFPELPIDVDVLVCDRPFRGGWYPYWGNPPVEGMPDDRTHLRVCSIQSYPPRSVANALQAIDHLRFPYRWSTRWMAYPRQSQDYVLARVQKQWVGQEKGAFTRIGELMSRKEARVINTTATNQAEDADEARQEVGADLVAYGDFTATIVVWDEHPDQADAKIRDVMQILDSRGFVTILEKEHATAAWLSSLPGNRADSVRRTPHHSLTFAHLSPGLAAAWTGPERDEHLDGPPWFFAHTEGATLFRVVNHVNDWGHHLVLGPTRSGKSTLLAFMVAQWLKYRGSQVFWFDVGRSGRCLTLCLGGQWYDLGSGEVGLQPYRRIDDPVEQRWVYQWTLDRLVEARVPLDDDARWAIGEALDRFTRATPPQRTMTEFVLVLTQMLRTAEEGSRNRHSPHASRLRTLTKALGQIVRTLTDFTTGHIYGQLLDANHDDLGAGPVHTFEQQTLLTTPRLVTPVMQYVFHRIEQRFDTNHPTLLPMDDAAVTWVLPDYERKGREWAVTQAKKNVSLGFFTHSLVQVFGSSLGALLLESCPTRFILPNPAARAPELAEIYRRMGLNAAEIALVASARPQRDYYYSCELLGKRPFTLQLSPVLLALLARNREDDHTLMDTILAEHGPEDFAEHWLEAQGFPAHAARLRTDTSLEEVIDAAD